MNIPHGRTGLKIAVNRDTKRWRRALSRLRAAVIQNNPRTQTEASADGDIAIFSAGFQMMFV